MVSFAPFFVVVAVLAALASAHTGNIYSSHEVSFCHRIRGAKLVKTPTHLLAFGRCCGANLCSNTDSDVVNGTLGDNNKDNLMIQKRSDDNGQTWIDFKVISPGNKPGYAGTAVIYDRVRSRLVLLFDYIPGGSTQPANNASYFRMFSYDSGHTWVNFEEVTSQIAPFSGGLTNMFVNSAGSKAQTPTGRLLFPMHKHSPNAAVVYSDDGGMTFKVSNSFPGSEISVAMAEGISNSTVYMNGRGQGIFTDHHRAQYYSTNDGATWSAPTQSQFVAPDNKPCEGAVLAIGHVLYFSQPLGSSQGSRTGLHIHCSFDNGKTWPKSIGLNGPQESAGYSIMQELDNGDIAIAWEDGAADNIWFTTTPTNWCT